MPAGGSWKPLKREATDYVKDAGGPEVNTANLFADFLRVNGGSRGISAGHGGSAPQESGRQKSTGGSGKDGRSAVVGTARNLGSFLSRVADAGLEAALHDQGRDDLIGKSANDVFDCLLEEFAGPASTLDNALAREALAEMRDELLEDAATFEEVEQQLEELVTERGIFGVIASFFGNYVFRLFCRNFYEVWLKKVGAAKTNFKLNEIKDYITSSLRTKLAGRRLGPSSWKGKEGTLLSESVLKETIEVFGVTG